MTLTESYFLQIIKGKGWKVEHEFSLDRPDDHWWRATRDTDKISHFTITGLFEAWMEHPTVLKEHFSIETLNAPKEVVEFPKIRKPIEGA